ncbi:MAG TPA: circadian clock protein KaiC [Anaeromyxobacter sp.]|nr:circadian clock protein KaiC [Anaeromyxobacter sp.]
MLSTSRPRRRAAWRAPLERRTLAKTPSGIRGLDEITRGGLPRGRPTLICGGPGSGKTLFALEFLLHGAEEQGEPGVLMSFEESEAEIGANVASLGFDLPRMVAQKRIVVDQVRVERAEIEETGEFNLEGLFVRLQLAVDSVGAKRVALDAIESLFSGLPSPDVLRSELRRLFRWLKDRGLTAVITGEKGEGALTRHGLEEYVSDCVIFLDHRVVDQISTRRLRVVKYRGSTHGTNEYPFLIDQGGISVLPITSLGLEHAAPTERLSTGLPRLDEMLGGKGPYRGSSILISGTAGAGKTSFAAQMAREVSRRGRCLFFSFEESAAQIIRNMRSIGIDLETLQRKGGLRISTSRPATFGLEMHLAFVHRAVEEFRPELVVVDPISSLLGAGARADARSLLTRLIDYLKGQQISGLFTSLTAAGAPLEETEVGISSLIDTWLVLEVVRSGAERNRLLTVMKSRGMAHSNQAVEFRLSGSGIEFLDTYLGPGGVLSGSARVAREVEDRAAAAALDAEVARREALRASRRRAFEGRLAALREEFTALDAELALSVEEVRGQRARNAASRTEMGRARQAFERRPGRKLNGAGRKGGTP